MTEFLLIKSCTLAKAADIFFLSSLLADTLVERDNKQKSKRTASLLGTNMMMMREFNLTLRVAGARN